MRRFFRLQRRQSKRCRDQRMPSRDRLLRSRQFAKEYPQFERLPPLGRRAESSDGGAAGAGVAGATADEKHKHLGARVRDLRRKARPLRRKTKPNLLRIGAR